MFSASPSDLVKPSLRLAVITPLAIEMSNLDVTSAPDTESYALMSEAFTVNLVSSKSSVIPTVWMLSLLAASN